MFQVMKRTTAALLVAAAIFAPTVSAIPIAGDPPTRHAGTSQIDSSDLAPVQTTGTSSDGFDWGDAGIGAAAMFTLLGLGTGSLLVSRRSRERRPATTS
jgi:hypothetical protein